MPSPLASRPSSRSSGAAGFLLIAAPIALALLSPVGCERVSSAYPIGMRRLRECPLATEALGPEPDKTWGLSTFRLGSSGPTGSARFRMAVAGSRRRGEYAFVAARTGDAWALLSAVLTVGDRTIDVARCGDVSPGLPAAFASVAALPAMPLMAPGAASGLAVLAPPPPGLTGVPLTEFYCRNGLPAVCTGAALPYLHGAGVPRDVARARELLDLGCQARMPDACAERAKLQGP